MPREAPTIQGQNLAVICSSKIWGSGGQGGYQLLADLGVVPVWYPSSGDFAMARGARHSWAIGQGAETTPPHWSLLRETHPVPREGGGTRERKEQTVPEHQLLPKCREPEQVRVSPYPHQVLQLWWSVPKKWTHLFFFFASVSVNFTPQGYLPQRELVALVHSESKGKTFSVVPFTRYYRSLFLWNWDTSFCICSSGEANLWVMYMHNCLWFIQGKSHYFLMTQYLPFLTPKSNTSPAIKTETTSMQIEGTVLFSET